MPTRSPSSGARRRVIRSPAFRGARPAASAWRVHRVASTSAGSAGRRGVRITALAGLGEEVPQFAHPFGSCFDGGQLFPLRAHTADSRFQVTDGQPTAGDVSITRERALAQSLGVQVILLLQVSCTMPQGIGLGAHRVHRETHHAVSPGAGASRSRDKWDTGEPAYVAKIKEGFVPLVQSNLSR